jgi:hypothetical protein
MADPVMKAQVDPTTGQVFFIDATTDKPWNDPLPASLAPTTDLPSAPAMSAMMPAPIPAVSIARLSPESIVSAIRAYLGNTLIPQRQAALSTAIPGLQRVANASPLALLMQLAPQVSRAGDQATTAVQQASRQLGPGGGGQPTRAAQGINAALAQAVAQLFGQASSGAGPTLLDTAQGTSSFLPKPATTSTGTSTQTSQQPWSIPETADMIKGLYGLGRGVFGLGNYLGGLGSLFGGGGGNDMTLSPTFESYGGGIGWS